MLCVLVCLVANAVPQYDVEPLPFPFFAANDTGTVLLRKSNNGQYDYWRYSNGEAKLVAVGLPGDSVRLLDRSGTLYGSTSDGEGLRFERILVASARYNRRLLGKLADGGVFAVKSERPNGQFYATTSYLGSGHAVLVNPDRTYQFLAGYTNGRNSTIVDCNLRGQAVGTTTVYNNDEGYTTARRWNGATGETLTGEVNSSYGVAPATITEAGAIFGHVYRGEFFDSRIDAYIWRNPDDYTILPRTFGNRNYARWMNENEEAVGEANNNSTNPVPYYYRDGVMTDFRTISDIGQYAPTAIGMRCILDDGTIFGTMTGGTRPGSFIAKRIQ